jgi:hypothetical protein
MKHDTKPTVPLSEHEQAAHEIAKSLLDNVKIEYFSEAEREKFCDALDGFAEAVGEILTFYDGIGADDILRLWRENEGQPQIDVTLKLKARDGSVTPEQWAQISGFTKKDLIGSIAVACLSFGAACMVHPIARERLQAGVRQIQTARGRAKRSAKTELGRKLVREWVDRLFSTKPEFRGKRPNRIATEIERDNDIEKILSCYTDKERPQLGHSAIRKHVEDYLAEQNKPA